MLPRYWRTRGFNGGSIAAHSSSIGKRKPSSPICQVCTRAWQTFTKALATRIGLPSRKMPRKLSHHPTALRQLPSAASEMATISRQPDSRANPAKPDALFWATKAYNQLAVDAFDQLGKLPDSVEIHALKAEILHGHGQDAEAANEWRAALALAPGDPRLETELAASLFAAHKYDEVMPMLTGMLAREPNAPDLNFMMGESLWRTQQAEKAVPYLTAALKADPELLPAHAALGMVDAALNQNAEAVPHLEKALSLDDDGSLHYSLARAYQASGNSAQARTTMQEYQQIRQKNQQVNDELAKEADITAPVAR